MTRLISKWSWVLILGTFLVVACQKRSNVYQGYVEGYFTYLSSNTDGFLQQLNVKRGDIVKVNQQLFILENQPQISDLERAQQKLKQAQADLANLEKGQRPTVLQGIEAQIGQAEAELEYAQQTFLRYERLVKVNAISKAQYDQARSDFQRTQARLNETIANLQEANLGARSDVIKSAEAVVQASTAELNSAAWFLDKKSIEAPADGVIHDTFYRTGEFIPAGRPVVSLLVPDNMRVIFYIPEPHLNQAKYGQKVTFACDSCTKTYSGVITFISSKAEFTPPIIYSERERAKFVYRIEAKINSEDAKLVHAGQPVDVILSQ